MDRAHLYNAAFPDRPQLTYSNGWVTGTWCIGSCYKNENKLYGAYPRGYLERVHSMFPDARSVLHVFSGGLSMEAALVPIAAATCSFEYPGVCGLELELVDLKGPEDGRFPTWQGNVCAMPPEWTGRFDLVLADPPYSKDDAERYGVAMPLRRQVMHELRRVTKFGGNLVWLDQQWPQHRSEEWKTWGHIGLVRSTNHRMRLVSMFQAC